MSDLIQEVNSMASLLGARRGNSTQLGQSLLRQIANKLNGCNLNITDLLQFTEHVQASTLSQELKEALVEQCDKLAMLAGQQSGAMKLKLQPQACDSLENYLTASDWQTLDTQGLWAGVQTLVSRLKQIGIKSLRESLKRKCIGILILLESKKAKMPSYDLIWQLGQHFGQAFAANKECSKPGVPSLLDYPHSPFHISDEFVGMAYASDDPPLKKDLPDLAYICTHHIPVRRTSKLLKEAGHSNTIGQATPQQKEVNNVEKLVLQFQAFASQMGAVLQHQKGIEPAAFQNQSLAFQPQHGKAIASSPWPALPPAPLTNGCLGYRWYSFCMCLVCFNGIEENILVSFFPTIKMQVFQLFLGRSLTS